MSTLAEQWMEQGLERGLQQGLEQGLQQGLQQGYLEGLTVALEVKFGEAGRRFADEVRPVATLALLRSLQAGLLAGESLEELRAHILTPPHSD